MILITHFTLYWVAVCYEPYTLLTLCSHLTEREDDAAGQDKTGLCLDSSLDVLRKC
jgi:hypothetical protein